MKSIRNPMGLTTTYLQLPAAWAPVFGGASTDLSDAEQEVIALCEALFGVCDGPIDFVPVFYARHDASAHGIPPALCFVYTFTQPTASNDDTCREAP